MSDATLLGTAAAHASARVPTADPDASVGSVRAGLAGKRFDCADDVAVLKGSTLVGLVAIERLLAAEPEARIGDIMDADPPVVTPGAPQEHVAWRAVERGESSVAVVEADGSFRGLIPPHRLLGVLLVEHDEDMARLGGYLHSARQARTAVEEPVVQRLWHRLPWLLVGLLGASAFAGIIGAFERQLEKELLLASFVPGVVYMADAVGTQTETLVIRGLSAGVALRTILLRELVTGLGIGVALALAFLPLSLLVWGNGAVAVAVALALLASCSIATLVAMVLPWAFGRLGVDPAFGSGPLATVVQDLLSILVYFAIAAWLVT